MLDFVSTSLVAETICAGFRVRVISGRGCLYWISCMYAPLVEAVCTGFRVHVISGRGCLCWISCPRH